MAFSEQAFRQNIAENGLVDCYLMLTFSAKHRLSMP